MATDREFQDMLNDFLPNELLSEELVPRDYVLKTVEKENTWKTGPLVVPFKGGSASSVKSGGLTASDDVAQDKYVRGEVTTPVEIWGTMLFNHRDLMEHDKVSEQNFLRLLPDAVEDFTDYMKNAVSVNLLNSAWFAKLTAAVSANTGNIVVDHPERFTIGQKVKLVDGSSDITGYVKAINLNTATINLVTTRGGSTVLDFQAGEALDVGTKCYNDGFDSSAFSSLRDALLSAANGGSTTLYGQTKTTYPYLQSININGAAFTADNLLEKIFFSFVETRRLGKGNPRECLMSWTNLGYCMAAVENQKGSFNVIPGSNKASDYGWMEIEIGSVTKGSLKLVGIQECDDDIIMFIDWRGIKFYSNGFFQKRKGPNGNEYFEVRGTTGYQYLIDICLFGELVVQRPSYCGIIHSIAITKPVSAA